MQIHAPAAALTTPTAIVEAAQKAGSVYFFKRNLTVEAVEPAPDGGAYFVECERDPSDQRRRTYRVTRILPSGKVVPGRKRCPQTIGQARKVLTELAGGQ